MTESITVTHENFDEVLDVAIIGNIALQNYGSECISSRDVRLSVAGTALIEKLIDAVIESGNSIFTMIQPKFLETGYDCNVHFNEADFRHITEIQPFSVEIPHAQHIYSMCQSVHGRVTDRAQFLADMKYR